jgi:hypothetical protein
MKGERLFNLNRGTSLYYQVFELADLELETLLDSIILKADCLNA